MTIMGPGEGRQSGRGRGEGGSDSLTNQAKAALIELPTHLRQIGIGLERLANQGEQHYYTLAPARQRSTGEQVWGVFCLSCSEKASDYVWPCEQKVDSVNEEDHPPQFLVASNTTQEEDEAPST